MSRLEKPLGEIQKQVGGSELVGDPEFICRSVAPLDEAGPEQLSFVKDERYFDAARESEAGALLVPEPIEGVDAHQVVCSNPFLSFGMILMQLAEEKRRQPAGIDPRAILYEGVECGKNVTIGPGAVIREQVRIGDGTVIYPNAYVGQRCTIGSDVVIHPNVTIMEDITIGDRVTIHGGSVIGADGYGYVQMEGQHIKVPQIGEIRIEDDVEIGALATIDRATMAATRIGRGTKIGDLTHVAHNCDVGEDVLLLPTVAVSGSCTIKDRAVLAGRAGTSDNITVGEESVLGACSVAYKDVPDGAFMWGNPAQPKRQEIRTQAILRNLPDLARDVRKLKKTVGSDD